jgi:hypothetical protein
MRQESETRTRHSLQNSLKTGLFYLSWHNSAFSVNTGTVAGTTIERSRAFHCTGPAKILDPCFIMQFSGGHSFAGTQSVSMMQSSRPASVVFGVIVFVKIGRVAYVMAVIVKGGDVVGGEVTSVVTAVEAISVEGTGETGEVFEVHPETTANAMQNKRINPAGPLRRDIISLFMPHGF